MILSLSEIQLYGEKMYGTVDSSLISYRINFIIKAIKEHMNMNMMKYAYLTLCIYNYSGRLIQTRNIVICHPLDAL